MLVPWSPSPISESSFVRYRRCSSITEAISLTTSSVVSVVLNSTPSVSRVLRIRCLRTLPKAFRDKLVNKYYFAGLLAASQCTSTCATRKSGRLPDASAPPLRRSTQITAEAFSHYLELCQD